jgi:hypothetical protein
MMMSDRSKIVHGATARRSELEGSSNIAPHTRRCETTAGDRHTRERGPIQQNKEENGEKRETKWEIPNTKKVSFVLVGFEQCCAAVYWEGRRLPKARCQDKKVVTAEKEEATTSPRLKVDCSTDRTWVASTSDQSFFHDFLAPGNHFPSVKQTFQEKQTIEHSNGEIRSP